MTAKFWAIAWNSYPWSFWFSSGCIWVSICFVATVNSGVCWCNYELSFRTRRHRLKESWLLETLWYTEIHKISLYFFKKGSCIPQNRIQCQGALLCEPECLKPWHWPLDILEGHCRRCCRNGRAQDTCCLTASASETFQNTQATWVHSWVAQDAN